MSDWSEVERLQVALAEKVQCIRKLEAEKAEILALWLQDADPQETRWATQEEQSDE